MKKLVLIILLGISISSLSAQTKWAHITSQNENNKACKGILLDDGTELIKPIYEWISYTDKYFFCKQNNKWGVLDSTGKMIIQPLYDETGYGISEDLIRVRKDNKWGYINISGETIIQFDYDFACNFRDGKAYAIKDGKPIFISKTGKKVKRAKKTKNYCPEDIAGVIGIENQFDSDKSLIIKESDNLYGVVDTNGNIIIPIEYDEIGFYYNDVINVRKGNLWGAYKNNGEIIVEPKYKSISLFW